MKKGKMFLKDLSEMFPVGELEKLLFSEILADILADITTTSQQTPVGEGEKS